MGPDSLADRTWLACSCSFRCRTKACSENFWHSAISGTQSEEGYKRGAEATLKEVQRSGVALLAGFDFSGGHRNREKVLSE